MRKWIIIFILLLPLLAFTQFISKEEAVEILTQIETKNHPNSDNLFITNELYDIDEHCLGTCEEIKYKKILTEQGRQNNFIYFYYDLDYSILEVNEIEIIKSDGKIIKFDPQELLIQKDPNFSGGSNIYSYSTKILTGTLPNLEIGDIIYTKSIEQINKARMPENFSTNFSLDNYREFAHKFMKIELPNSKQLYIHELNDHGFKYDYLSTEKDSLNIYEWTSKFNPLIIYEPEMELFNLFAHHIKITTIESWEDISRWYHELVDPHLITNLEIREKVKELTKDLTTREEKAAKIFYWVAQKIRYLGVDKEKERPGYEPHDVIFTYETRGGVCRDKAALLVAMLREAGIESDVILIASGNRLNKEAPVVWFNHAITVSYDKKGTPEFFFDPTDENTKDFLPNYEEDSSYLIASEKGETLKIIPVSDPKNNNSTVIIQLELDEKLNAKGKISYSFKGYSDTIIRSRFNRFTKQDYKNYFEKLISNLHPNATLVSYNFSDPQNKEEDMKLEIALTIPKYGRINEKNFFIQFDASKLDLHLLYKYIVSSPLKLSQRNYDFKFGGSFSFDIKYDLDFAQSIKKVSIPKLKQLNIHGFTTEFTSKFKKKHLSCHYHFENDQLHFKKEDFQNLKSELAKLTKYQDLYIIGEMKRSKK
ncbi:MAG: DUF3857 and transglutaminase domain-containing protein [Candidatus Cloacimonetes bacterium]|nr:DUF3857 and transglutaminase domain-containing protein [Candidatus Cloacimonadota bacterium]